MASGTISSRLRMTRKTKREYDDAIGKDKLKAFLRMSAKRTKINLGRRSRNPRSPSCAAPRENWISLYLLLTRKFKANLATGGNGASRGATSVLRVFALMMLRLLSCSLNTRADVSPRAIVKWLLLAPKQLGVGIFVEMRCKL
jgi:hypothetical protein